MAKFLPFLFLWLILTTSTHAQQPKNVTGSVMDSTGAPLNEVNVKIISGKDSMTTTTGASGTFIFNRVTFRDFDLNVSMVGYKTFSRHYSTSNAATVQTIE